MKTPLGCNINVRKAPAPLPSGVLLWMWMDSPDNRTAEVFLSDDNVDELRELLLHPRTPQ